MPRNIMDKLLTFIHSFYFFRISCSLSRIKITITTACKQRDHHGNKQIVIDTN